MGVRAWIAVGLFLAWSAALLCSGLYVGALAGRLGKANAEQKTTAAKLKEVLDGQAVAEKRQKAIQNKLDKLPRSQGVIREIVRENPSGCVLPPAVVDSLRDSIRKANASRKVPANP